MTPPPETSAAPAREGGEPAHERGGGTPLDALLEVSMPVVIEFGRANLTVQQVLALGPGSVIQLDRMVGEPVDIYVSDRKLAQGEVVVMGEYFGIRITRVLAARPNGAVA
jgi:flagellar motor switch protein FliN/FliY